ncbi:MAG: hypothetical protein FRX49_13142 [Trebouxia sp. A1-2]|nr:MAG: hypothetical protein FRX49_13142 [Trebouxia sp. A1-2]
MMQQQQDRKEVNGKGVKKVTRWLGDAEEDNRMDRQIQGSHSQMAVHELEMQHEVKALTPGFDLPACADADFAWSFEFLLDSNLAFSSA